MIDFKKELEKDGWKVKTDLVWNRKRNIKVQVLHAEKKEEIIDINKQVEQK